VDPGKAQVWGYGWIRNTPILNVGEGEREAGKGGEAATVLCSSVGRKMGPLALLSL
jgi:hypothetical protein